MPLTVVYMRDDGHDTAGLWGVRLARDAYGRVTRVDERGRDLLVRTGGVSRPK